MSVYHPRFKELKTCQPTGVFEENYALALSCLVANGKYKISCFGGAADLCGN